MLIVCLRIALLAFLAASDSIRVCARMRLRANARHDCPGSSERRKEWLVEKIAQRLPKQPHGISMPAVLTRFRRAL
jgi:hypothetical protein